LKSKISQYRYLDFEMFTSSVDSFSQANDYCKLNKTRVSDDQIKAIFLLLDVDESGELEQEEVIDVLQDRQLLGQSRDTKAKQEAVDAFNKTS